MQMTMGIRNHRFSVLLLARLYASPIDIGAMETGHYLLLPYCNLKNLNRIILFKGDIFYD